MCCCVDVKRPGARYFTVEDLILTVSERALLREVFARKGVEMTGGWRRLYIEELHGSYCSSGIIRVIR